ncbi:MAG TPA: hypothetical protein VJB98_00675 [Candidatus Paceibacterota bacterium]
MRTRTQVQATVAPRIDWRGALLAAGIIGFGLVSSVMFFISPMPVWALGFGITVWQLVKIPLDWA